MLSPNNFDIPLLACSAYGANVTLLVLALSFEKFIYLVSFISIVSEKGEESSELLSSSEEYSSSVSFFSLINAKLVFRKASNVSFYNCYDINTLYR